MSGTELFQNESSLMFGQVREDALVDLFLVNKLVEPQRVFVIASGGCTVLSLLSAGSFQIDAVDISQAQISLVETKVAMFKHLGGEQAVRACAGDATENYLAVAKFLSPQSKSIMDALSLENGLNNCGFVDRRMREITRLFYAFVHSKPRTRRFLTLGNATEQTDFYKRHWSNLQWRMAMKVAFSKVFLYITHGKAAATLVPDNFSSVMESRLYRALTAFPNASNPYLWQAFFGKYNDVGEGLPPYLQTINHSAIAANLDNLRLTCADTLAWLVGQPAGSIDYFGLSNILELLPQDYATKIAEEIIRCARPNALICVRAIFPRKQPIFAKGAGQAVAQPGVRMELDKELSREAEEMDRSLFCNFFEIYRLI